MLNVLKQWCKLLLLVVCMITLIMFHEDFAFAEETPCSPGQPCLETIQQPKTPELQKTPCLSEEQPCFSQTNQPKRQPKAICLPGQLCTRVIRMAIATSRPVPDPPQPPPIASSRPVPDPPQPPPIPSAQGHPQPPPTLPELAQELAIH